jgi:RNA polymerase sigma-70 factor (sigma-E family)
VIPGRDRREFDTFVREHADRLTRTAFLLTGDRGHAEDVVQVALLRTARRWRTARRAPAAYARAAVVNLAKDRWRSLGRRPPETALPSYDVVPVRAVQPDAAFDHRDQLVRAARGLPEGQREVLVLRYFEDLSVEETAQALGCSTGTVKSQTSRALANLRAALAHEMEDADAHR